VSTVAFAKSHIIVTRQGKEVAAVIPFEQLAVLQEALERLEDAHDIALIEAEADAGQMPWEAVAPALDD